MSDTPAPAIIRIGRQHIAIHTLPVGWRIILNRCIAWECPSAAMLARMLACAIQTALLEGSAA